MRSSPFALGSALALLCLMGFGCKQGWNDPLAFNQEGSYGQAQTAGVGNRVVTNYPITTQQAVDLVQQALKGLDEAKSFRTTVRFPMDNGYSTAVLEVDKARGLHGTLQSPGPVMNEMYLLDGKVYYRSQSSDWVDLSGTNEGKQVQQLMDSIFKITGDDLSAKDLLSDASQIQDISTDRSGCTLVIFRPKIAKRPEDTVSICVKDGKPTQIIAATDVGQALDARYWDYGKTFVFTKPEAKPAVVVNATTTAP